MKIILIAPGNSIHIERWCDWLTKKGNDIVLITDKKTNIKSAKVYKLKNPHDHKYPLFWTIITKWNANRVKSIVSKERPDIVHLHYASQYLTSRLEFKPFFVSVWGSDIFKLVDGSPGYRFARLNLTRADVVFTVSEQMKLLLEEKFPFIKKKIDCFTWGIDTDFFKKRDKRISRKELGLPMKGVFFLAPRGINDVYRPELIIQAFNIQKKKSSDTYLILLAGFASDDRRKKIRSMIDENPSRIIFINETLKPDQMLKYYNSSDYYLGIPLYDQVSAALLEAMLCGLIPIVSKIQPYKELIHERENGFYFEGDNPRILSDLLNYVIFENYGRTKMIDTNIALVKDRFNWNDESKKMMAHYKWAKKNYGLNIPQ